jgi:cold shock CspA family protein
VAEGEISRFNLDKGWGFIKPDSGGDDVMLHVRELCTGEDPAWLQPGVRVSFDARRTSRGLRAANVRTWLETRRSGGSGAISEGEFREAVHSLLDDSLLKFKRDLVDLARSHGWVELWMYTEDEVAFACHEFNRVLQRIHGDPLPSAPWDCESAELRESTREGVLRIRRGWTMRDNHEEWRKVKAAQGWTYGPVKDYELKTHPGMADFDSLPQELRDRAQMFFLIVTGMTIGLLPEVAVRRYHGHERN